MSETDTASVSAGQGTILLNQAGAIAVTIENPDIRTEVLYRVANNYLDNNHLDGAVSVMGRMQDGSLKDQLLTQLITVYMERRLLQEALHSAEAIQREGNRSFAFVTIAMRQAEQGDVEGAFKTVERVAEVDRDHAIGDIAQMQIKSGDIQGAIETVKRIKDYRWGSILMIVHKLAKSGDLPAAMRVVDVIAEEYLRANALASLASYLKTNEQFDELLRASETLKQEGLKGYVLYGVAVAETKRGNVEKELSWAKEQSSPILKSYILLGCAEGLLPQNTSNRGQHVH